MSKPVLSACPIPPQLQQQGRPSGKVMIVLDDAGHSDVALNYALQFACPRKAGIAVLYVLARESLFMPWGRISETMERAHRRRGQEALAGVGRRIGAMDVEASLYLREGKPKRAIKDVIDEDPEISRLILAADSDSRSPGKLVSYYTGRGLRDLKIPLTIVPTHIDFTHEGGV